jgi:pilus assembly protein Flp/PilA
MRLRPRDEAADRRTPRRNAAKRLSQWGLERLVNADAAAETAWHCACDWGKQSSQQSLQGGRRMTLFTRLWRNDEGQDLAEYALLIALIALVVIGAVTLLGTRIQTVFNNIANALNP